MQETEILGVLLLSFLCLVLFGFFFSDDKNDATQLMSTKKFIFSEDNHKTCSKAEIYWSVHASHLAAREQYLKAPFSSIRREGQYV